MRLTTNPGHSAARIGTLRICCANVVAACVVSGAVSSPSITSISRMNEAGQKKWKPTTLSGRWVASAISVIDRPDVLEARIAWPGQAASRSANTSCLIGHLLGHRLDDEVDVAEAAVVRRARDPAEHARDLLGRLFLVQLALLDELRRLALRHLARLGEAVVDEPLLDVLEHDGHVRARDHLRDLAAHDAGADDRGLEDEHGR